MVKRVASLLLCVVLVFMLTESALAQQWIADLYGSAVEFVGQGDWGMALYTFRRVIDADPESDLALKSLVWSVLIRAGLWAGNGALSTKLRQAADKAVLDSKAKFTAKAQEYMLLSDGIYDVWTADLRRVLARRPGRYIELVFPAGYEVAECDDDYYIEAAISAGVYPGDLAIEDYHDVWESLGVPAMFDHCSVIPDTALQIITGKGGTIAVDMAKFYLWFGKLCAKSPDLRRACCEEVLRLTEGELANKDRLEAERLLSEMY